MYEQPQNFDETPPPAQDTGADPVDPMVDLHETTQELEELPGQTNRSKVNKATLAMIGLFVAGAAVVGILSMRSGPAPATANDQAAEEQVNSFIARTEGQNEQLKDFKDTKEVVDRFYNYASSHQVPVDDLKANPFVFGDPKKPRGGTVPSPKPNDDMRLAASQRRKLHSEFDKLNLQSIMMSPRGGTAIINNNFVAEGHKVGSFTVTKVHAHSVELSAHGVVFTLRVKK